LTKVNSEIRKTGNFAAIEKGFVRRTNDYRTITQAPLYLRT